MTTWLSTCQVDSCGRTLDVVTGWPAAAPGVDTTSTRLLLMTIGDTGPLWPRSWVVNSRSSMTTWPLTVLIPAAFT